MSNLIPLFYISEQQKERRDKWCKQHGAEAHPNGVRDIGGAAFKYTILPTGTGDNIEVECIWCPGKKIILSEDDGGDFMYDEDGRKTWCSSYANPNHSFEQKLCNDPQLHIQRCVEKGKHMKYVDDDGDCKFCCHH